jgi:phospholipid-binding lipoprotein MlaA
MRDSITMKKKNLQKISLKTILGLCFLLSSFQGFQFQGFQLGASSKVSVEDMNFDFEFDEEDEAPAQQFYDPFEKVNRKFDGFNRWLAKKVMAPVARQYVKIPAKGRKSVGNFFSNLKSPLHMVNLGFQGKFDKAGCELGRFLVNSTVGLVGLFDIADSQLGLKQNKEDFGQTLGHYGVKAGPYVHLPMMGPTTLRDFLSSPFDWGLEGDRYLFPNTTWAQVGLSTLEVVNQTPSIVNRLKGVEKDAIDPYTMIRDGYLQMREAQVRR